MGWFLYDRDLRHETFKYPLAFIFSYDIQENRKYLLTILSININLKDEKSK